MNWLLIIPIVGFAYGVFMLIRNAWVYKVRTRCLHASKWNGFSHEPYNRLPSYEAMMRRFWIWDINKFL